MLTNSAANTGRDRRYSPRLCAQESVLLGRFFVCVGLLFCTFFTLPRAGAGERLDYPACRSNVYDETAIIKYVVDGDTVILTDNRHVRLIGINAPEIARDARPPQPGAVQAHKYLLSLLPANTSIRLRYDRQRLDRYKRTLAHLFLENGSNVQALLLIKGLSTMLTIPPNLEFLDCYESRSGIAQSHQSGLWSLSQYQPMSVELLTTNDLGYRVITGTVTRIVENKSAVWITLADKLSLHIAAEYLHYFENLPGMDGNQVTARGSLYFSNGEFRMHIRHPTDMWIMKITDDH